MLLSTSQLQMHLICSMTCHYSHLSLPTSQKIHCFYCAGLVSVSVECQGEEYGDSLPTPKAAYLLTFLSPLPLKSSHVYLSRTVPSSSGGSVTTKMLALLREKSFSITQGTKRLLSFLYRYTTFTNISMANTTVKM